MNKPSEIAVAKSQQNASLWVLDLAVRKIDWLFQHYMWYSALVT
jgi:hypothetical protein